MNFISLQLSPYISYHKLPKPHSIAAPPRRPPPLLCLPMKNLPTFSDGSVRAPPNQRLRSEITTASASTDSKTTNLSTCGDTEKGISCFNLKFDANANNDAVDSYPHLPPHQTYGEFECLTQPDAYSADNIDVWKSKLDTLLHDKDKQEIVSREKKDRRDYEQIAALASRMDLYSHLYVKAVVVSKVPLPSYRFDLDDKRPQREVFLSLRLQKRVQAHLLNYISEKPTRRGMFSGSSSNATIVTDDLFENPEPFPHSKPNDENILWRKSLQMRDKQRTWQESTKGREILEFRRNLPAFKEKDTILSAISQNQLDGGPIMVVTLENLQKMAMRFLSLTSSSSGCERNWSQFEGIHTKKRNKLETSRLNDLVYVKFNANLMKKKGKREMGGDSILCSQASEAQGWLVDGGDEDEVEPGSGLTWRMVAEASGADEVLQPRRSARNIPIRELDEDLDTSEEEKEKDVDFESDDERIMNVVDGAYVDDLED